MVIMSITTNTIPLFNKTKKNIIAKIYVVSSWRNSYQQDVVSFLRNESHEVYDFTHPRIETNR